MEARPWVWICSFPALQHTRAVNGRPRRAGSFPARQHTRAVNGRPRRAGCLPGWSGAWRREGRGHGSTPCRASITAKIFTEKSAAPPRGTLIHGRALLGLGALRELDLSHNRLALLTPETFLPLSSLAKLNLGSNRLGELEPGVPGALPQLQALLLQDNPWVCSCSILPLWRWLSRNREKVRGECPEGHVPTPPGRSTLAGQPAGLRQGPAGLGCSAPPGWGCPEPGLRSCQLLCLRDCLKRRAGQCPSDRCPALSPAVAPVLPHGT
uniref:Uncharacterized protein n=1 Tax=Ficedula albicollis TaxID=59894 RepID=U3JRS1_FICAL